MKYYLHDTNAFQDDKITELFIAYGFEGLGLFYTILEKIALQEKPIKTSVLKQQLKVGKKLEKVWKFIEEIGLIHSKNGETFNINVLENAKKYLIKKEKTRERVAKFRQQVAEKQPVRKKVTRYKPVTKRFRNTHKENIIKEKKSKLNKSKKEKVLAASAPSLIPDKKKVITTRILKLRRLKNKRLKFYRQWKLRKPARAVPVNYSKLFTDTYIEFYKSRSEGAKPKFTKADGVAAAELRTYLRENSRSKDDEGAIKSLQYIFANWPVLDNFCRNAMKLTQINSNINNIIVQIKQHSKNNGIEQKSSDNSNRTNANRLNVETAVLLAKGINRKRTGQSEQH